MTGIAFKIREALMEGPATIAELAATFELPTREVQVGMWCLTRYGHAEIFGKRPNDGRTPGARFRNIYRITPRGCEIHGRTHAG